MKRIKLIFTRNINEDTKSYRVYRNTKGNVTRKDSYIMEIEHPENMNPVYIQQDVLKKIVGNEYESTYKKIVFSQSEYRVQIFINNQIYTNENLLIDYPNGKITFPELFSDSDLITMNYYIDGIAVFDSDEIEQQDVKYYGPTAKDNSVIGVPQSPYLVPENNYARIKLTWDTDIQRGQYFYYRIESVDIYGNFSNFSEERYGFLKNSDNVGLFIIERTFDDPESSSATWRIVSKQQEDTYYEYGVDKEPPGPATELAGDVELHHGDSIGTVSLNWKEALPGLYSQSGVYRIRSMASNGVISRPSEYVGPVTLRSIVEKYVIRRKINDGTVPTYKGNDAITVGTIVNPTVIFDNLNVPDNKEYVYAVYAVDKGGNYSIATTVIIEVGDATPPEPVIGLSAASYSYLY